MLDLSAFLPPADVEAATDVEAPAPAPMHDEAWYERKLNEPWLQDFIAYCTCGGVARVLFRPRNRTFALAPEAIADGWRFEPEFGYYCGCFDCQQAPAPAGSVLRSTEETLALLETGALKC